ncbi:MAG: NAD-dependent epimerase/dehydratase family protein [Parvularculaceae bacterium]
MTLSLVTGAAGFVGGHLVEALQKCGEEVRALDLAPVAGVDAIQGSVVNPEAARRACEGVDCVFHLAGDAQLWSKEKDRFERINVGGAKTMLAAARAAGVKKFVQCSSLTTLVGKTTPIGPSNADESVMLSPGDMLGVYPRSKAEADLAVMAAASEGFDASIAIPTEPLGAGDKSLTPPSRLIVDLLNGRTPATIDCMLNFVSAKSLAEGFIAIRDKGERGGRYLLGGENVPMRRLLETLARITGKKMPGAELPYVVALAAGMVDTLVVARVTGKPPAAPLTGVRLAGRRVSFSSEKAMNELGWGSEPFEAALKEAVAWFSEQGLVV